VSKESGKYTKERMTYKVVHLLDILNMTISTVESATGGGIATEITSVPGSSGIYKGSIIAYTQEVKEKLLKIDSNLTFNESVNMPVTLAMAIHGNKILKTDITIATTGFFGPYSYSKDLLGNFNLVIYINGRAECYFKRFQVDRTGNRTGAVVFTLKTLYKILLKDNLILNRTKENKI
jgi:nicotinamide-nucleotide amidase